MAGNPEAQSVLDYWYNPEKDMGYLMKNVWFGGGEKQDSELREKFGSLIEKARNQELKSWEGNSHAALAHILLIDQFCRSVYRGSPKSFDCDPIALAIAKKLVAGDGINHKDLKPMERVFAYIPFEHSENLDDQNTVVSLMEELAKETEGTDLYNLVKGCLVFAQQHLEVIQKFGRFPKRNAVLGRTNTPEEEELFKNYPYSF